jgi:hypothetical protein
MDENRTIRPGDHRKIGSKDNFRADDYPPRANECFEIDLPDDLYQAFVYVAQAKSSIPTEIPTESLTKIAPMCRIALCQTTLSEIPVSINMCIDRMNRRFFLTSGAGAALATPLFWTAAMRAAMPQPAAATPVKETSTATSPTT